LPTKKEGKKSYAQDGNQDKRIYRSLSDRRGTAEKQVVAPNRSVPIIRQSEKMTLCACLIKWEGSGKQKKVGDNDRGRTSPREETSKGKKGLIGNGKCRRLSSSRRDLERKK